MMHYKKQKTEALSKIYMYDFSEDCVLVVLASDHYNESDYIRDYENFKKEVKNGKN